MPFSVAGPDRFGSHDHYRPALPFHDRLYRPAITPPALCVTPGKRIERTAERAGPDLPSIILTSSGPPSHHVSQKGVDLKTVQQWLGHTDLASTMRYLQGLPWRGSTS